MVSRWGFVEIWVLFLWHTPMSVDTEKRMQYVRWSLYCFQFSIDVFLKQLASPLEANLTVSSL